MVRLACRGLLATHANRIDAARLLTTLPPMPASSCLAMRQATRGGEKRMRSREAIVRWRRFYFAASALRDRRGVRSRTGGTGASAGLGRMAATSRRGGAPNRRLYSRLNCDGLS